MGLVTEKILALVLEQVNERRTVVWFDPEGAYATVVSSRQSIGDAPLYRYDPARGFIALRRELETHWSAADAPPQLVIYVPCEQVDTAHALIEFTVVGAVMQPGQQPPECNTDLVDVARAALSPIMPAAKVEQTLKEIHKGSLDLADLDTLAEKNAGESGALALIFQSGNLAEIVLRFLSEPALDNEIQTRNAVATLSELVSAAFEFTLPAQNDLVSLRAALTRHLLVNEFVESLRGAVPERLKSIPRPKAQAARESIAQVVREWRLRRDLGESYMQAAQRVEAELGLGEITWAPDALRESETFYRTETALQAMIENALANQENGALTKLAQTRTGDFWSAQKPESKLRWQIIGLASEVLQRAAHIERELQKDWNATQLVSLYASGDTPWCELDRVYRHLERDYHRFDPDDGTHDELLRLVSFAQQRYREITDALALRFVRAYETAKFEIANVLPQTDLFKLVITPALEQDKVGLILVDAFRFEMAREFVNGYAQDLVTELAPAIATAPSITAVGMSALLPGAERSFELVALRDGKLGVNIGGTTFKNKNDRIKHLIKIVGDACVSVDLSDLAPLKKKALRTKLNDARLIVVSASDEIDGLWEMNPALARQMHEDVFNQLRRGIRSLFSVGVRKIIITSDHGFLIGAQLIPAETFDAPGGETVELKRRVWVGKGGAAIPGCLRTPVGALGSTGDLELVTPYGLACFKVPGGSTEYFHGGLSLQELVIPVLIISSGPLQPKAGDTALTWELKPGANKITTQFFSITVQGQAREMFPAPPRVRVEIRAGEQLISVPVAAAYGFQEATRDVLLAFDEKQPQQLVPNAITLQITETPNVNQVTLSLLDAETGATLALLENLPLDVAGF